MNIGVLMRLRPGQPAPPESLPIGRAALELRHQGVRVIFGQTAQNDRLQGFEATPAEWKPVTLPVVAALDRYGSFSDPDGYRALLTGLGSTLILNPPRITALLRDKIATQIALQHLGMPELASDPRAFPAHLQRSGSAFLKPRYGSFGRGVEHLHAGDPLPPRAVVDGVDQALLLQRAISPFPPWKGVSLRILAQRGPDGPLIRTPVARVSTTDSVVNRARGAEVLPADALFPATAIAARALALSVLNALPGAIEIGVDAVVNPAGEPLLIEVNARPRGRLAALASTDPGRFHAEHLDAVRTPLLALVHATS